MSHRRPGLRRRKQAGVSLLLEALVGLGLFGCALLIVFGIFPTTHQSITQARRYTEAINIAREYLEQERTKSYSDPLLNTSFPLNPQLSIIDGHPVDTTYEVAVSEVISGVSPDDMKLVTVTVGWTEGLIVRRVQVDTAVAP